MTARAIAAFMYSETMKAVKENVEDDRDNWRFKKVDTTGALIAILTACGTLVGRRLRPCFLQFLQLRDEPS